MINTFYKILTTTLIPGDNTAVFTDGFINDDSVIECFTTDEAFYPIEADQSGSTVSFTFKDHIIPLGIAIVVFNSLNNVMAVTDIPDAEEVKKAFSASGAKTLSDAIDVNSSDIMDIFNDIGDLSELETTLKDSLVNAINEVKATADSKSVVAVTPIITEGSHIADIEVDGVPTELYAPSGGSGSGEIYDDDEIEIGTWNGEKLYRKVCHPTLPSKNTWGNFSVDIPSNAIIKNYYGVAYFTANVTFNIPMYYASDTHIFINGGSTTGSNIFGCHWNYSKSFVKCDFIVEYTKEVL